MNTRLLTASLLAIGLLSPAAFAAENYNCSQDQLNKSDYADCKGDVASPTESQYGAAIVGVQRGPVGDFIDETPSQSRERSSNRGLK